MIYRYANNFNNEIPSKSLTDFRSSVNEVTSLIEDYTGTLINTKGIIYESVESWHGPEYFDIDVPSGRIPKINKSICKAGYSLISESESNDGEYRSRFAKDGKNGTIYVITFFESSFEDDENDSESYIEAVCLNDTPIIREALSNDSKCAIDEGIIQNAKSMMSDNRRESFNNGIRAIKYMRKYRTKNKNVPEDFRKLAISIGKKFAQLPIEAKVLIDALSDRSVIERRISKISKKKIKNQYSFTKYVPISVFRAGDTDNKLKKLFTSEGFSQSKLGSHFFYKNGPKGVFYFGQYAYGDIDGVSPYPVSIMIYCIDDDGDIKSYVTTGKAINGDRSMLFAAKRPKNN